MTFIICVVIGIVLELAKANAWFIVPDICSYIVFGLAIVIAIVSVVNFFMTIGAVKSAKKDMRRW